MKTTNERNKIVNDQVEEVLQQVLGEPFDVKVRGRLADKVIADGTKGQEGGLMELPPLVFILTTESCRLLNEINIIRMTQSQITTAESNEPEGG